MDALDDERLWHRVRGGDGDAFADLFDRYASEIQAYCFRRTADHGLSEELTSIVFLEAWRRRSEVVPIRVLPWLYGVAINVLRNQWRSRRRYRAALDRLPPPQSEPDFSDAVAERLDAERRMRQLLDAVRALPALEQEVLALCLWQGLTGSEAATALQVPEATVRTRLHRARGHLAAAAAAAVAQPELVPCKGKDV